MKANLLTPRAKSRCRLHTRRILVVDDDREFSILVRTILETTQSYIVREENRAEQAMAAAEEFNPDLILMDIMMPGTDGGDVASLIKGNPRFSDVPIVFVTGSVTEAEVTQYDGYIGGLRFLAKPVRATTLLDCVAEQIEACA
jgi:CheY-like chemotaxis protein